MKKLLINSVYSLCVCCMAILMPFGLTACSNDEFADYKKDGDLKSFTSFTATLDDVAGTRAYLDAEASNGIRRAHWETGDVISVYSDTDKTLREFVLTELNESGVGTFTGKGITGNQFYAVFAPNKDVEVDADDPNVVHIKGAASNIVADQGTVANFTAPMVATSTGSSFSFQQITGLVKITVGNVHQVDDLFFRGSNLEPIGEDYLVDMSDNKPVLKLDEGANSVGFGQIIKNLDDNFVDVYYILPPMVFENGFLLTISGVYKDGNGFEIDKSYDSRFEVKAGSISSFSMVDVSAELEAQGSDEIIVFGDPVVKQICVENWDTNGDGELSYKEVAAVTDIGQLFRENTDIESFDEFQYFTGVTSIGEWAFANCSSLTNIMLPESVASISDWSFVSCVSLTSFMIPINVTSIGNHAIQNCSNLTSIVIPKNVASIGDYAFATNRNLTNIIVDKNNSYYDSRNDCNAIIETKSNTLVTGCVSTVIPNSVTSIGNYAFYCCKGLLSFLIPENVTSIGEWAFTLCSNLTSIEIPNSVTTIGNNAFTRCSSLTSLEIPEGVTSIGVSAFSSCINLTSVKILESVTSIGASAFSGCNSLTSILLPESLTSINPSTFSDCSSLTSIVIPEGVTSIGQWAFQRCSSLTSFTCLATSPPTIDRNVFNGVTSPIYVPAISVEAYKAADGWSNYASQIKAIPLDGNIVFADNNVKAICVENWDTNGDGELSYAEAAAVTDIGQLFRENTDIESFDEFQYFTGVTSIGFGAFDACSSLASIVIPEGVTSIGIYAFRGCSSLISIGIPDGVTSIGIGSFDGCSSLTSIVIPEGVTSIGSSTFIRCSSLTSIKIPEGVTAIGSYAFNGCSSLTIIELPEGVTSIDKFAFWGCSSLTDFKIPEGVTSIGDHAFSTCSSLTNIKIPESVTYIGILTFMGCSSLTSIEIPERVTSIGDGAFESCSKLTSIEIPEGVTSIGERAFYNCKSLTSFSCLATTPPTLGSYVFNGVTSPIYVPAVSVDAYKAADGWRDYADRIQAIPE
ncbi:MAG: leucine-rich repeat protein [Bacteroidaceae bacterium]|nr:leucine-rich repeat protein [Bacteroidaceae bacterium]